MPTLYQRVMTAGAVVLGLAGIIAIHVMDLQGKLEETPYLAAGYVAVCLIAGFLIVRMVSGPSRRDFLASAALSAAVFGGYVVNRTVGMPGAMGDIGNWMEPLGLLSLVIEAFTFVMAVRGVVMLSGSANERVDELELVEASA
jgi:hypothetical protein